MEIAARLVEVRARIEAACRAAGRDPSSVTLVAVSKTVAAERCREAVQAGQAVLGENYAQELRDKAREVAGARWHFIGPLQRNKVKYVVGTAELIHSVDSLPLVEEIANRAAKVGVKQRCLIQVNVGDEAQKSGCDESQLPSLLEVFAARPEIFCDGLMCIPPANEDATPYFKKLRELSSRFNLRELSMGMSADYERAIAEGATLVRVGTKIFGER